MEDRCNYDQVAAGQLITDVVNGYAGVRTQDGIIVATVRDGQQSPLRHVVQHSPDGLNWGYGGSGPADLALSILADAVGIGLAEVLHQDFKWTFVANWKERWEISMQEISEWLESRQMSFPAMEG